MTDATDWALKELQLGREIKFTQELLRANLREAWANYRCVAPGISHPTPWKVAGEPDFRGMLQKMVEAAKMDISDNGTVTYIFWSAKLRDLFHEAHTLLNDTE